MRVLLVLRLYVQPGVARCGAADRVPRRRPRGAGEAEPTWRCVVIANEQIEPGQRWRHVMSQRVVVIKSVSESSVTYMHASEQERYADSCTASLLWFLTRHERVASERAEQAVKS